MYEAAWRRRLLQAGRLAQAAAHLYPPPLRWAHHLLYTFGAHIMQLQQINDKTCDCVSSQREGAAADCRAGAGYNRSRSEQDRGFRTDLLSEMKWRGVGARSLGTLKQIRAQPWHTRSAVSSRQLGATAKRMCTGCAERVIATLPATLSPTLAPTANPTLNPTLTLTLSARAFAPWR